jgi:hypothetical protein
VAGRALRTSANSSDSLATCDIDLMDMIREFGMKTPVRFTPYSEVGAALKRPSPP